MPDADLRTNPQPLPLEQLQQIAADLIMNEERFALEGATINGNLYRVFKNAPANLAQFFAAGADYTQADETFLIFDDERYSYRQTWENACRFANVLANDLNVQKGDRVAIAMRNFPEWCFAYMGAVSAGAVVVPLNAWWKTEELSYALKDCGAKTVVVDAKRCGHLQPIKQELGLTIIGAREEMDGADFRFDELIAKYEGQETGCVAPQVDVAPDDDFCISYTSGSTGDPKGVVLTHRGAISAVYSWSFAAALVKRAQEGLSPMGENPGILLAIPLFHVTGSHSIFLLSWLVKRRISMMFRWDAKDACDLIRKERLTNFVGVPAQSFELIDAAGTEGLPSMVDFGCGGAKRPPEHVRKLKKKFKKANPSSGYGLTETNALGCVISPGDYLARPDSTGRAVPPLTDIKIMIDDATEAPLGEIGEIWIRSPANFREYLNMPKETEKALTSDGWFRTGDLGRLDDQGFVFIVDRLKDLIIRGGENISCIEVENHAYEYDGITEAAAFSVPDDTLGELVGLAVFAKDGVQVDATALRDFMAKTLAYFKVPERIWVSPQPLPRLATGKFDKRTVKKFALTYPPNFKA